VWGAAVLGDVERVGHAVVLRLQADLDDFHWVDDGHGFGYTGSETSYPYVSRCSRLWSALYELSSRTQECGLAGNLTRLLVGQHSLVGLV
jgi:hypothetical protein